MHVAVFSSRPYDREFLDAANAARGGEHALSYFEVRLDEKSALLAADNTAVCAFVNDHLDRATLNALAAQGVKLVALRSAGFNHVDLAAAQELQLTIARVPSYSPEAVAEHTAALILCLNRKIHKAFARVREGNFSLDGLLGFDLCDRTVGIIGTGKIGLGVARIMRGFGCRVLAYDPQPDPQLHDDAVAALYLDGRFVDAGLVGPERHVEQRQTGHAEPGDDQRARHPYNCGLMRSSFECNLLSALM